MADPLNVPALERPRSISSSEGGRARPVLSPLVLCASLFAIAGAALAFAAVVALIVAAGYVALAGREAANDLFDQIRFDLRLYTRLSAAVVSLVYVGFVAATLGAALAAGRRQWSALVALRPVRVRNWDALAIPACTLAYGAATTFLLARIRARHLVVSGPTDYTLIGLIVLNLVMLAPLSEELFFRGWLYTGLRGRYGFWPSFLLTSAAFSAIHWDANHHRILLVLPLALALGLLRERTGSIKPTIALHAFYNLMIVAITLAET